MDAEWDRVLPLEGAFNLRDFGGYPSQGGGHVRKGMLYRSGTMHRLSEADERHLAGLGIATVFDLRRPDEQEAYPTRWCNAAGVDLFTRDHDHGSGVLEELLLQHVPTAVRMRDAMLNLYAVLAFEHAPSYRIIFERLLDGKAPLLLHCAAGKDRTGVGVAMILSALDVPRDTIVADYAMTADVANFDGLLEQKYGHVPREVVAPLLASEPAYLEAVFRVIEKKHGSVHGFLSDELGVGETELQRLRELLIV